MHSFTDNENRRWTIAVNVSNANRVRDQTGVDLFGAVDGKLFAELADDPAKLVNVLHALCGGQRPDVTPEQFAAGFAGDVIDTATKSLIDAIIDFFPKGHRAALRKVAEKIENLIAVINATAIAALQDPTLDARLQAALSAGSPTSSPALAA